MSSEPRASARPIRRHTSLSFLAVSTVINMCQGMRITQVPAGIARALSGRLLLTNTPRSSLLPPLPLLPLLALLSLLSLLALLLAGAVVRIVRDGNSAPCRWRTSNKSATPSFFLSPHGCAAVVEEESSVTMP